MGGPPRSLTHTTANAHAGDFLANLNLDGSGPGSGRPPLASAAAQQPQPTLLEICLGAALSLAAAGAGPVRALHRGGVLALSLTLCEFVTPAVVAAAQELAAAVCDRCAERGFEGELGCFCMYRQGPSLYP